MLVLPLLNFKLTGRDTISQLIFSFKKKLTGYQLRAYLINNKYLSKAYSGPNIALGDWDMSLNTFFYSLFTYICNLKNRCHIKNIKCNLWKTENVGLTFNFL